MKKSLRLSYLHFYFPVVTAGSFNRFPIHLLSCPPSPQPAIYTATPIIIGVTPASATPIIMSSTSTPTFLPTSTNMVQATATEIPANTLTPTSAVDMPALQIIVLGCNTSIDVLHGMGEVTNAFVTLKNTGNIQLTNLVATLYALVGVSVLAGISVDKLHHIVR